MKYLQFRFVPGMNHSSRPPTVCKTQSTFSQHFSNSLPQIGLFFPLCANLQKGVHYSKEVLVVRLTFSNIVIKPTCFLQDNLSVMMNNQHRRENPVQMKVSAVRRRRPQLQLITVILFCHSKHLAVANMLK